MSMLGISVLCGGDWMMVASIQVHDPRGQAIFETLSPLTSEFVIPCTCLLPVHLLRWSRTTWSCFVHMLPGYMTMSRTWC
jgi:hypothetical protein